MDIYGFIILGSIIGYLIGSIPFAVILSKVIYKVDVRKHGSGNSGATNVARTLGAKAGLAVLIFDVLKGGLTPFLMYKIAEFCLTNSHPDQLIYLSIIYCVTGACASIGHCHPIFSSFNGGKAVASICGFLIFSNYKLFLVAIITFLVISLTTKIVSLGSISAAVIVFIVNFIPFFQDCFIFKYNELNPEIIGSKLPWFMYMVCISFLALLLIFRHISNIKKLIKKEEKKFSFGKFEKQSTNSK
jgi:glycerol-3-phosphate acyltransferase PlsY